MRTVLKSTAPHCLALLCALLAPTTSVAQSPIDGLSAKLPLSAEAVAPKDTGDDDAIELNPTNDYLRAASELALPATNELAFVTGATQQAFLVTPPPQDGHLWQINLGVNAATDYALRIQLVTIRFDEHQRVVGKEVLLEATGLNSLELPPQIWPQEPVYLLVASSSAVKAQLTIDSLPALPLQSPEQLTGTAAFMTPGSVDTTLNLRWLPGEDSSEKWRVRVTSTAGVPYALQLKGHKQFSSSAFTNPQGQIVIDNIQPGPKGLGLRLRATKKTFSPLALAFEKMPVDNNATELESHRNTPLPLEVLNRGSLSHLSKQGRVEKDTWLLDLTGAAGQAAETHISVAINSDRAQDMIHAVLATEKGNRPIVQSQQRGSIVFNTLSLAPQRYMLHVSSSQPGVTYSVIAQAAKAPGKLDEREPNNSAQAANSLTPRKPMKGSLSAIDKADFFLLDTNATGESQLWRLLATGPGAQSLTVDDKYSAKRSPDLGAKPLAFKQLLLLPGKHYIKVRGDGAYTLRALPLGPPKDNFEVEPNDGVHGPYQALQPGQPITGTIEQVQYGDLADEDYYRFTVTSAGYYRLTLTPPQDRGLQATLTMYDRTWFDASIATPEGTPLVYTARLLPADYTLRLTNLQGQKALDEYTVLLERIDASESALPSPDQEPNDRPGYAAVVAPNSAFDGRLEGFDQRDYFKFDPGEAERNISVTTAGGQDALELEWLNHRGDTLRLPTISPNNWTLPALEHPAFLQISHARAAEAAHIPAVHYSVASRADTAFTAKSEDPFTQPTTTSPTAFSRALNVAWLTPGARWQTDEPEKPVSDIAQRELAQLNALLDGAMPQGAGARLPSASALNSYRLKLAADSELIGMAINTRVARRMIDKLRRFELHTSTDGVNYTLALRGELSSTHRTQYFEFERPITARYAKLVALDTVKGQFKANHALASELMLFSATTKPQGIDLTSADAGGHVVYHQFEPASPSLIDSLYSALIDPVADQAPPSCSFGKDQTQAEWVVGLHHNRSARVSAISYAPDSHANDLPPLPRLKLAYSNRGPLGPWHELADWQANELLQPQQLDLAEQPWVRFLRFQATGEPRQHYACPGDLKVQERMSDEDYTSILAHWDGSGSAGPYEAQHAVAAPPTQSRGGPERAQPATLNPGTSIASSVQRERNEDWYRVAGSADGKLNSIVVSLAHPESFKPNLQVYTGSETQPLPLTVVESADDAVSAIPKPLPLNWRVSQYQLWLPAEQSALLRLEEPRRNTVIAWDASGSMTSHLPYIHSSVQDWARHIQPEHEQVKIQTLEGKPYPEQDWANYPYMLQAALEYTRNNGASSSNSEKTLISTSKLLTTQLGNRAVVITSDGVSRGNPELWQQLQQHCPQIYAAGMGGGAATGISLGDVQFNHWQDKFQDWVSACGGRYEYCDSYYCLEQFYADTAAALRHPKPYQLSAQRIYAEPPAPGTLSVSLGRKTAKALRATLYVILDASGSMLQRIDGKQRIDIAKTTLKSIAELAQEQQHNLALRTFGLRSDECHHELTLKIRRHLAAQAHRAIDKVTAVNLAKTPIADSLLAAGNDLASIQGKKLIVLLTDGEETCDGDPEAVLQSLRGTGMEVKMFVVAFALQDENLKQQFQQWAQLGGGRYYDAQNEAELQQAMHSAVSPRFEVRNEFGEAVLNETVGSAKYPLPPGNYQLLLLDTDEPPRQITVEAGTHQDVLL